MEDIADLQSDLDQLVVWEKLWSMEFHPDKCFLLRVTNKRKCLEGNYTIHNQVLKQVDKAKYLGVTLSKDLSWKHHVNVITSKATNTRLFLQRNLTFADSETKLKCYKAYVRPIVEYASSVWNPVNNSSLTKKIESVQRKSLRWIYKKWSYTVSPTDLQKQSGLSTLESRRESSRLKMFYDLFYKKKHVSIECMPTRQRCLNLKFNPIRGSIKSFENSFFPDVVKCWNNLKPSTLNETNENQFLNKIRELEY